MYGRACTPPNQLPALAGKDIWKSDGFVEPMSDNEQKAGALPDAAIAALRNGRKIEAVKIVRREWNIDLKEAKDAVDQHLSSINPSPGVRRAPTIETGTGRLLWLVFVIIVVFIGYYLWTTP